MNVMFMALNQPIFQHAGFADTTWYSAIIIILFAFISSLVMYQYVIKQLPEVEHSLDYIRFFRDGVQRLIFLMVFYFIIKLFCADPFIILGLFALYLPPIIVFKKIIHPRSEALSDEEHIYRKLTTPL